MHHDPHLEIPIRRFERFPRRLLMVAGGAALLGAVLWLLTLLGGDDSARACR